jgi:hypothetical protein
MMGGRLDRSIDEVSELVTSRPAWMLSGDPSAFNEEQLKEYKEYMAKEAAAIEERLKRKGIMVSAAVCAFCLGWDLIKHESKHASSRCRCVDSNRTSGTTRYMLSNSCIRVKLLATLQKLELLQLMTAWLSKCYRRLSCAL